ncbi:probable ATP-dependent RNA helicase DHX37 [Dendronephthya gigantea]|uniref:probable ATP-dependent RNA helicase DHX37 n=1 Tax=Dendronephthya gigantea TaxID=151771 RepID=UPI00106D959E|nr:probable ATP-dependent RNA helicase DHX37 [Dendronephthya gigantea]
MGRLRKRHNWKARIGEDNSSERGLKNQANNLDYVQGSAASAGNEDDRVYGTALTGSNTLALPSKKSNKGRRDLHPPTERKRLSKKARKRLEKIVESKKKKSKRADVLNLLAQSSVSELEISQYNSVSRMGQVNKSELKRGLSGEDQDHEIQSLVKRGRKKGKKERLRMKMKKIEVIKGVEVEDCSEESDDDDDDDDDQDDNDGRIPDKERGQKDEMEEKKDEKVKVVENESNKKNSSSNTSCKVKEANEQSASLKREMSAESTESTLQKSTIANILKEDAIKATPTVFVEVNRDPDIQTARLQLPILGEEQAVMEAIKENEIILLVGETGSGKTTQVPQFLYEAGYTHKGTIGITEPRRVAAVNMSERVAFEMSLPKSKVSYQIRYEGNTTSETCVKFMTDGVLLREVEKDFLLSNYSVIVIDEAHERSVYTDILIGLLSRIVLLRKKHGNILKLIIMSATLRVDDFTNNMNLFSPTPPVVKVEARQFPVTIHFSKRTPTDYVNEAFRKVVKIHKTLPNGGILVFLTGQNEIHSLCRKLQNRFPFKKNLAVSSAQVKTNDKKVGINLDNYSMSNKTIVIDREMEDEDAEESLVDNSSLSESEEELGSPSFDDKELSPMYVLPLYSLLSNEKQRKVFESPPEGVRYCVVATNVAETSLTIPNMKYVVDAGMVKRRYYDKTTGVSSFRITWTSKASANQRAGRAGRIGPGHCYRLYSSAVFNNDFEEFTQPDILRRPVDDLVLQMKAINIDKVANFPFPTPPESNVLQTAEKLLINLGALTPKKTRKGVLTSVITSLGRTMTKFPVSPRYAKMLCLGHQNQCLEFVIVIVAALTVHEIFSSGPYEGEDRNERLSNITKLRRRWAGDGVSQLLGDFMVMLRAVGAAEFSGCSAKFCQSSGLRHKAMLEVRKLRVQLTNAVNGVNPDAKLCVDPKMKPPSPSQTKILRQIILSCFGENVARRMSSERCAEQGIKNGYECHLTEEPVFIHPTSALFTILPEFILFQEIIETTKLYVKGVAVVEPEWFALLIPQHCTFSKPLKDPSPRYDQDEGIVKCHMNVSFGARVWCLPAQELEYQKCSERYKWFARFLLEGHVVSKLATFSQNLLALPSTMVKTWSKLQPRTEALLRELVNNDVDCRASLLAMWKKEKDYLLKAYLGWIPESKHDDVKKIWPPVK